MTIHHPHPDKPGHQRILAEPRVDPVQARSVTTYDPDGRLLVTKMAIEDRFGKGPYGLWVEGAHDGSKQYVLDGVVVPRPPNTALLTGTTLYNVPLPSRIAVTDMLTFSRALEFDATDATVELDFKVPGLYGVRVMSFPPVEKSFEIEVT